MHRLRCLLVIGVLAVAVSVVGAGPAFAAKGGNNDTAKVCQKGGWQQLFSDTGETFVNQGDCVNDGARGRSVFATAGEAACHQFSASIFRIGVPPLVWDCLIPKNPSGPLPPADALQRACATDALPASGNLTLTSLGEGSFADAQCHMA